MTPADVATYGGGVVALALVLWYVRGSMGAKLRRESATDTAEQGLIAQMRVQLDDSHARNRELNDRYHQAMQQALDLARTHGQQVMQAVNDVRREHHDSMVRVHAKLERAEAELEDCRRRHEECDERVAALEARLPSG